MSRRLVFANLLVFALAGTAGAAPRITFTPCVTAMETRGLCAAGDVVEIVAWSTAEWQGERLPELAAEIGYQVQVLCAAERQVDRIRGGVLLVAGVGDPGCTAELVGQQIANPQPIENAVRRALHAREVLADYDRRVREAQEAARQSIPFPEDLEP